MYEREERLIDEAKRQAAKATANLTSSGKGGNDAPAILAIQQAIIECESAQKMISSVYQTLRSGATADPTGFDPRRQELLPRAWTALLSVEQEKDFLINDLDRLQNEANRPNKQ